MSFDDVCIILNGYAHDAEQLNHVVKSYGAMGFNNIVVSSYQDSIPDKFFNQPAVILNDDTLRSPLKEVCHPPGMSEKCVVNYQINTINKGIVMANYTYGTLAKYYFRCRADILVEDLDKCVERWRQEVTISRNQDEVFRSKIVQLAWSTKRKRQWYVYDYWAFGLKEDINSYYNINFLDRDPYPELWNSTSTQEIYDVGGGPITEQYLASAHILSVRSDISWPEARERYFIFDKNLKAFWYKYDKHITCDSMNGRTGRDFLQ